MDAPNPLGPLPRSESVAFCLRLRPGTETEYKKRHDEIWPEMRATIVGAGVLHFEIHLMRETGLLFAFVIRRPDHEMDSFRSNPVWRRWQAHMSDILIQDGDGPLRTPLERVFSLQASDSGRD